MEKLIHLIRTSILAAESAGHRFYMIYYEEGMRRGAAKALKTLLRNSRGMRLSEKRQWRKVS